MRITTKTDLMIKTAPNKDKFIRPKSFGAHDTMCGLIDWACTKLSLFNNRPNDLMVAFGEVFDQIKYEEAEQTYDTEQFVKIVTGTPGDKKNPGLKVKSADAVLDVLSLSALMSGTWARDNCIKSRPRTVTITQHRELYNFIVDRFVACNFSTMDLNKIADMGVMYDMATIVREASKVADIDKRNISYLYAIIRSINSKDEILRAREAEKQIDNDTRVAALFEMLEGADKKEKFISNPNALEEWDTEREFISIFRDLVNGK